MLTVSPTFNSLNRAISGPATSVSSVPSFNRSVTSRVVWSIAWIVAVLRVVFVFVSCRCATAEAGTATRSANSAAIGILVMRPPEHAAAYGSARRRVYAKSADDSGSGVSRPISRIRSSEPRFADSAYRVRLTFPYPHRMTQHRRRLQQPHPAPVVHRFRRTAMCIAFIIVVGGAGAAMTRFVRRPAMSPASAGMKWIPGGDFTMGTDSAQSMANERPAHVVRVNAFWMAEHDVTNAEFGRFVQATGYVTTAERKPEWDEIRKQLPPGTLKPADSELVPGSLVFTPPTDAVPLDDLSAWWQWVPGADWRHPS